MPAKCTRPLAVTIARTVISLRVSVPVLSDAITVAAPRVSTAESLRTIALRRAMRRTPTASTAVTMAGIFGTAATPSATPSSRTSVSASRPRTRCTSTMVPIIAMAMQTTTAPSTLPTWSSSRCSGVVSFAVDPSIPATRPISVRIPVATTTARPRPYVTVVPLNSMSTRSASAVSVGSASTHLSMGTLSPVSEASAARSAVDSITRASAGTVSPSSSSRTSPTTSSRAGMRRRSPSRTTVASAADIERRAATACSARDSCTKPSVALRSTIAMMAIASYGRAASRSAIQSESEIAVAARSSRTSTLRNCARKRRHAGIGGSAASSFGPSRAKSRCASASASPRAPSESSIASTARAGRACHSPAASSEGAAVDCGDSVGGLGIVVTPA